MNDELDIRSGGAIEVDTDSLRRAASAVRALAERARSLGGELAGAAARADAAVHDGPTLALCARMAQRAGLALRHASEIEETAAALEQTALRYEVVEAAVRWSASDSDAPMPVRLFALWSSQAWRISASDSLRRQAAQTPIPGPVWARSLILLGVSGLQAGLAAYAHSGRAGALRGSAPPVVVRELSERPVAAPSGMTAVMDRVPGGRRPDPAARVRIEQYELPGGGREWVVYVSGTRAAADDDAFDMRANLRLYGGARSASAEGVREAMRQAGIGAEDPVHLVGYSQGAMIVAGLADDADLRVRTLVTVGSPAGVPVPDDVLGLDVRHEDDPVAALSGQGAAMTHGAAGSLVVRRVADPTPGWRDVTAPAHRIPAYRETAVRLDASPDPRLESFRSTWARLGEGRGRSREYAITRPADEPCG